MPKTATAPIPEMPGGLPLVGNSLEFLSESFTTRTIAMARTQRPIFRLQFWTMRSSS
ncbi:hypothetical protein [Streptomyces sp. NPDC060065]|uniref:hypothetical protein n=1 Tax=Streptomyces sp. NPDC060065 TaxID=3347050 RepID=UPI00369795FD